MKKSFFVALLTPTSVLCALKTTAIKRVYGDVYSNSPLGSGVIFENREKISKIFSFDRLLIKFTSLKEYSICKIKI